MARGEASAGADPRTPPSMRPSTNGSCRVSVEVSIRTPLLGEGVYRRRGQAEMGASRGMVLETWVSCGLS